MGVTACISEMIPLGDACHCLLQLQLLGQLSELCSTLDSCRKLWRLPISHRQLTSPALPQGLHIKQAVLTSNYCAAQKLAEPTSCDSPPPPGAAATHPTHKPYSRGTYIHSTTMLGFT